MFDAALAWAMEHQMLVLAICFFAYQKYQASRPMPEYPGNLTSIGNKADFDVLLKANKVVIVDFYATWCPPCKTAAPVFAKVSGLFLSRSRAAVLTTPCT
jgi:thioredoxin 1